MARPVAGDIVLVDCRGGQLPAEPGGVRPAVVVEAAGLLADEYPNLLVVPLTRDPRYAAMSSLVEPIEPNAENGCPAPCWAVCHHVTSVSRRRVQPTNSRVTAQQVASIRARLSLALGYGRPGTSL